MSALLQTNDTTLHNEEFRRELANFDAELIDAAQGMKDWQINACGWHYQSKPATDIAKQLERSVGGVRKWLKTPEALNFVRIKRDMEAYKAGPTEGECLQWLTKLVTRHIDIEPSEARQAIAEINRMRQKQTEQGGTQVNVVINNVLGRGALDG